MTTASAASSGGSAGKLRRFVGTGILALVVAGVAWWAFANALPRPENARDFRPDPGANRGGNWTLNAPPANAVVRPRDPVTVLPRIVTIRDGDMTVSCSMRSDAKWNIYVSFGGESLGGAEAQRLTLAVRRVLDVKTPPANLKLTDEQRAKLKAISLTPLELSDDQLRQLTDLLDQSQKLTANAPQMTPIKQSLQQLAGQVKGADRAAIKQKYADRDAQLRAILSAEQVNTMMGPRNNNNNNNNRGNNPPANNGAPM